MKILSLLLSLVAASCLLAQSNKITGGLTIRYDTRNSTPVKPGSVDTYTVNLMVAGSAVFNGTVVDTPQLIDGWVSKKVVQPRSLRFDLACDVVNPANPNQTLNIGKLLGRVPINSDGVYEYDRGDLAFNILPMGKAGGFTGKFTGSTRGKPLVRPPGWLENLKREAVSITRVRGGKTTTITLKKYDKMEFVNHILGAGPIQMYQPVTVAGDLFYDYDKSCWFLNNMTFQYVDGNQVKIDRLSGTIRWVESTKRKLTGEGEYQFDIRVNEPLASATAVFDPGASDEASFFQTDTSVPALTGTMKYKDTLRGDTTLASAVSVDLTGNSLTKQQIMVLAKLIIFSTIVPMNGD